MRSPRSITAEAKAILSRHAAQDRLVTHVLPGLHLMRFHWSSQPLVAIQSPCMALVLQGTKSLDFGTTHLEYSAGQYLLSSIDMPVTSRIVQASGKTPLLAIAVQLDFEELQQWVDRCDPLPPAQPAINVFEADTDLLETIVRLLRSLDTPEHAAALAPLIRQEIFYRLLTGPSGSRLLEIVRHNSPSNRIAKALSWLKKHFAKAFMVDELARYVGMSPSSFHQHFKDITGITPIQYQKRVRLHEARQILIADSMDIGEASYRVGYQSHSQFSKDYRQYFGRLPKDDILAHSTGRLSLSAYSPEDRRAKVIT